MIRRPASRMLGAHMNTSTHEDLTRRAAEAKGGSDRAFGFVMAAAAATFALLPLFEGEAPRAWVLAVAGAFAALALVRPGVLAPFNHAWTRFGLLLHRIVNPVVLGLLFFVTVTPTALIMRALGKDPLRLRFEPEARTYWIERRPPGPEPETMRNQF